MLGQIILLLYFFFVMKKQKSIFTFLSCSIFVALLFAGLGLNSCTKSNVADISSAPNNLILQNRNTDSIEELIESAGDLHNAAMDSILQVDLSSFQTHTSKAQKMIDISNYYFLSNKGVDLSPYDTTYIRDIVGAILDGQYFAPDTHWGDLMSDGWLSNYVDSTEMTFVDAVRGVFLTDFTGESLEDICDKIDSDLDAIETAYQNTTWQQGTGHLAGGLIFLTKGSTKYVRNNYSTYAGTAPGWDSPPPQAWIQLDAFGYIVGWGNAVYNDWSNGTLDPSGQYNRINQGVSAAVLTSSGGFIRS